ncbi:uncharacterized protein LOC106012693 [Aplysia californica]|uniref:Uncharacterized protein LOC106012693 n=1 Tax=Aplysia californica TaxID=6500 RepID=A0ABM1A6P0_APLCA|nr:uncharacterized protein LOC106012693 [Aplysia californica]
MKVLAVLISALLVAGTFAQLSEGPEPKGWVKDLIGKGCQPMVDWLKNHFGQKDTDDTDVTKRFSPADAASWVWNTANSKGIPGEIVSGLLECGAGPLCDAFSCPKWVTGILNVVLTLKQGK